MDIHVINLEMTLNGIYEILVWTLLAFSVITLLGYLLFDPAANIDAIRFEGAED